jgi:3-deoxy-D-manno-octulosonate 8-phosphate phosphatase (KDO 8-P phosphatase)
MPQLSPEVMKRAERVRLVLLDVDGVLTDGRIHVGANGEDARAFFVRDGLGIRLGQAGGLSFGIISGRHSEALTLRASELGITEVHQAVQDKSACLDDILGRLSLPADATCFVGDDLVDLPVMRRVGLAAAPSDAASAVLEAADFVASAAGGRGAVREVVDLLLRASGRWETVTERFRK